MNHEPSLSAEAEAESAGICLLSLAEQEMFKMYNLLQVTTLY